MTSPADGFPWAEALPEFTREAPGRCRAKLDRSWWSWSGPHGGLLAALLLRTAGELAGPDRVPRALSVQFLTAPPEGQVELTAEVLRDGGSSSVVRATLVAAGETTTTATLTSARHRARAGTYSMVPAPNVPGPADCASMQLPVEAVPFSGHLDYRPATPGLPLSGGDVAELVAWVRLKDGGSYDPAALVVLTDVMPPALYAATTVPVPIPTVELSVVLHHGPHATGWVLTRIATRTSADGWCVDDSEVWDADGRLLAQARQVRRLLGDPIR